MYQRHQLIAIFAVACAVLVQAFPDDRFMHPQTIHRTSSRAHQEYEPIDFWNKEAQDTLAKKLEQRDVIKQAKNVIMFLGDGWGVPTMTLARILKGQEVDGVNFGEEGKLHVDTFPISGTSKTYCVDAQVADSACTATAYLCGVKANTGTIGVTSDVKRYDCEAQQREENHVSSILQWAQEAGKSTGVVTTTRITHASPSGTFAHVGNRDWESDFNVANNGLDPETCDDIAEHLTLRKPGKDIDVILGGGRMKLLPHDVQDGEGSFGERRDGKNLVDAWISQNQGNATHPLNSVYIETAQQLAQVDAATTDKLMGLFASDNLAFYHDQQNDNDPTLADMTQKAIEILSKNPNGFFLFVEGGRIDHAHHENYGMRALWEAVEFDRAIQKGDEMTAAGEDTLIVITADHSHAFSFAGYPQRGSPLNGIAGHGDAVLNDGVEGDTLPYATLNYANGPGFKPFENNQRHDISTDDVDDFTYRQVPLVPLLSETHGGEDVMIFAKGPFAHLLSGVQQQNYIPHVMAYASCVGSGRTYCDDNKVYKK